MTTCSLPAALARATRSLGLVQRCRPSASRRAHGSRRPAPSKRRDGARRDGDVEHDVGIGSWRAALRRWSRSERRRGRTRQRAQQPGLASISATPTISRPSIVVAASSHARLIAPQPIKNGTLHSRSPPAASVLDCCAANVFGALQRCRKRLRSHNQDRPLSRAAMWAGWATVDRAAATSGAFRRAARVARHCAAERWMGKEVAA